MKVSSWSHVARLLVTASAVSFGAISTSVHAGFSVSFEPLKTSSPAPTVVARDLSAEPLREPSSSSGNAQPISKPTPIAATSAPSAQLPEGAPDETVAMVPAESWILSPADGTMRAVLGKWASRAGWQLSWEASVDVPLTVSAEFQGDFRSAVKQMFASLSANEVNLKGLLYTRNRVLRVTEIGQRSQ